VRRWGTRDGTILHFCGIILDPNAPHGIAWILEPWAFVINNH